MTTWLVTGGAGFIGTHLVHSLCAAGDTVRVLDDLSTGDGGRLPAGAALSVADINDAATLRALMDGAAACIHLAAVASVERCTRNPAGAHDTNLRGTLVVFEQAAAAGVPVVYASSAAVYGQPGPGALAETAPARPLSAYGVDKLGCELHAAVAGAVKGLKSCGLRFFNVYGPGQDPRSPYSGVVSIFAERLIARAPLTVYGDGGQTRDFVHVDDVVRALRAAVARAAPAAPVCNVCTGRATRLLDLAATLGTVLGVPPVLEHAAPRAGDIRHSCGDPARMTAWLGVSRTRPLHDGLAAMLGVAAPSSPSV